MSNISKCRFLNKNKLDNIVKFILNLTGRKGACLSIVFVSDVEIKQLNFLYREKRKPTDVLAFSMRDGQRLKKDSAILGDVVISIDMARKQAKKFNSTFEKEIYLYIIHGILHLLGYDDKTPSFRKRMQKKENQILNALWQKLK